jgi:uncharacterized membrane protein YwzB
LKVTCICCAFWILRSFTIKFWHSKKVTACMQSIHIVSQMTIS